MTDAVDRAFAALKAHYRALSETRTSSLFDADERRFQRFSARLGPLLMDYSKTKVTAKTLRLLTDLAEAADLEAKRDAMFAGERINTTENRAVLHVALRNRGNSPIVVDGKDGNTDPDEDGGEYRPGDLDRFAHAFSSEAMS